MLRRISPLYRPIVTRRLFRRLRQLKWFRSLFKKLRATVHVERDMRVSLLFRTMFNSNFRNIFSRRGVLSRRMLLRFWRFLSVTRRKLRRIPGTSNVHIRSTSKKPSKRSGYSSNTLHSRRVNSLNYTRGSSASGAKHHDILHSEQSAHSTRGSSTSGAKYHDIWHSKQSVNSTRGSRTSGAKHHNRWHSRQSVTVNSTRR
jgi:hypothetical protein